MLTENFWIFVIKDTDNEFKSRMGSKSWPIHLYTANRKNIQSGDKILFYKAGVGNKTILGSAQITSEIKPKAGTKDYAVSIDLIDVWKKPALMKLMVESLDFIENNQQWGDTCRVGLYESVKRTITQFFQTINFII